MKNEKYTKPRYKEDVLNTIKYSDQTKTSYRGRKLRKKYINDKLLEVVTRTEGPNIIVVTAYILEGEL